MERAARSGHDRAALLAQSAHTAFDKVSIYPYNPLAFVTKPLAQVAELADALG